MNGSTARDGFAVYYTEKLWHLIPEVYRNADGLTPNPHALRQIIEVIAGNAASARRSVDRLWEDQHIETSDDWAVPYIGDLVSARLVSALDRRARRVEVSSAIRFRRRRGTPDLLDTLVRALSGWDVVLVEGFRRLARTRHRLDGPPIPEGIFSATPPGGTADLRRPVAAEISETPFGEYFHTLDTRLLRGRVGQFGIRKLNFHLYRLKAYALDRVDPVELEDPGSLGLLRTFAIDPSGRDVPLFIDAEPPDLAGAGTTSTLGGHPCRSPASWQVTHAMRCRLLGHVAYEVTASILAELIQLSNPPTPADEAALSLAFGTRFRSESAMRRRLQDFGAAIAAVPPDWYRELVELSLIAATGKFQLYPDDVEIEIDGDAVQRHAIYAADLSDRTCHPEPPGGLANLLVSPEQGRFATVPTNQPAPPDPFVLHYVYGFSGDVGAGPYPRSLSQSTTRVASNGNVPDGGVFQGDGLSIADNRTYALEIRDDTPVPDATLQASVSRRPYVRLSGDDDPFGANLRPQAEGQRFTVDGGWYASSDTVDAIPAGDPANFVVEAIVPASDTAAFDFDLLEIRHATFDPGGVRGDGIRIPPLRLLVRGQIRKLVIRRSIVGPIEIVRETSADLAHVEELVICDSIVDANQLSSGHAIVNPYGTVVLESSTVFGDVRCSVLHANNSLVVGQVRVINNQAGCFRFSASVPGPDVRLPPRYRDVHTPIPRAFFGSTRFGDPRYAQLSIVAPATITEGAEDGSEMGVFSHLLNPIRLQSIRAKVGEYGPAGMLAQYLFEDDPKVLRGVVAGPITPDPPVAPVPPPPDPGPVIPAPDPPPAPPLPEECDDDEATAPAETGPSIAFVARDADLGGAPEFWRASDWVAEALPVPIAIDRDTVPFDYVDAVGEYDARFGTLPEEQGWLPPSEPSALALRMDEVGAMAFDVSPTEASLFVFRQNLPAGAGPIQFHGYAQLSVRRLGNPAASLPEDRAVDAPRPGTGQAIELMVHGNKQRQLARGLRAGWSRDATEGMFHYSTLSGDKRRPVSGRRRGRGLAKGWHTVSMQGHLEAEGALASFDGHVDKVPLDWFGKLPGPPRPRAGFGGRFGFLPTGERALGLVRNFVVSSPGRFIRAWFRATAPGASPTLRLKFVGQPASPGGTARFLIRYGERTRGELPTKIPGAAASATLALAPGDASSLDIDVELDQIGADGPMWITIEREHGHPDDLLRETVRLIAGEWLG